MSNVLKYIEILSIEQVEDKYYLKIALHTNEVTEVYWQIDETTYENIYLQCEFNNNYRYRLSFKIIENSSINKLIGRITRTYLTNSSMIDFQTTKQFKEQFQLIRLHSQTKTLYQLEFIKQNIHGLYAKEQTVTTEPEQEVLNIVKETDSSATLIGEVPDTALHIIEEPDTTALQQEQGDDLIDTEPVEAVTLEEERTQEETTNTVIDVDTTSNVEQQEKPNLSVNEPQDQEVKETSNLGETIAEQREERTQEETTITVIDVNTPSYVEQQEKPNLSVNEPQDQEVKEMGNLGETVAEQSIVADTIAKELEEQQADSTNDDELQSTADETMTVASMDSSDSDSNEEANAENAIAPSDSEADLPKGQEAAFVMPIQTIMALPTIKKDIQHATIVRSGNEEKETATQEIVASLETEPVETNVNSEVEQQELQTESNEKLNIATEEEQVDETKNSVTENVASAEPIDPTPALEGTSKEDPGLKKQAITEKEVEESHHLSNNMIALLAVVVAIFIAVAIYFAFFQQNASTLNTDSAVASENTKTVTYNIEESFTFSLPKEYVALTFNRGPSPYTEQILNILNEYNYGATFFLQGNQVSLHPDLVKNIDTQGHSIGHITNSHTLLTILEIEGQRDALVKPKEEIEQLINKETLLVRPPFNTFNQNTISIQQEYNLKIVNSTIALKSDNGVQADSIIQDFLNTKKIEGAIIGLDESQATVEALPTILEKIKQSDLQVVILK